MLPIHSLSLSFSLQNINPLSPLFSQQFCRIITNSNPRTRPISSRFLVNINGFSSEEHRNKIIKKTRYSSCCKAVENDNSQQFEIDPDEAKQALQKLDQQLQTMSKRPTSSPKIKAKDVKFTSYERTEQFPEISGSFLANTAIVLVIFTIFYNVLFYAVIKPAIDGPDEQPEPDPAKTTATQSAQTAVLQWLPPNLEVFGNHFLTSTSELKT